jgi:glycosyltransferase involved in cell wall biosynthesis
MAEIAAVQVRKDQHERALRLYQEGRYEESARVLAALLKTKENSELWNDWATAQMMLGKRAECEEGYRRALELDPQSSRAAGNLGVLLATCGRFPEAIPLLERAANGSVGAEREQLLRLIERYRTQEASDSQSRSDRALLLQMATVMHRQSQAIASLNGRLSALRSGFDRQAAAPSHSAAEIGQTTGGAAPRNLSNTKRITPQRDGAIGEAPGPTASENADCVSGQDAPQPGVYFGGQVYSESEYAEEVRAAGLHLAEHGLRVQFVPLHHGSDSSGLIPENLRTRLKFLERQLVDVPKSVIFQSGPAPGWNLDWAGRTRVGRTMFDTDGLPEVFRDACSAMDEVWVPGHFNLETFAKGGVDKRKLRLVSGGVDTRIFNPDAAPLEIKPKRTFNFLSVLDWHLRTGYDALLRAYLQEFSPNDDVALVLKPYQVAGYSDIEAQVVYFIERTAGLAMEKAPAVILLNGFIPQSQMPSLYATADAFVLPSRGGACGKSYLEAMACQLPVVATNWGGQLDFLNGENCYLIDSRLTPVPSEVEIEHYRGHCWAEPSVDHLRQVMREVYSHPDEARKRAERGREDVLHKYDWSVVMPRWVAEFQRLLN